MAEASPARYDPAQDHDPLFGLTAAQARPAHGPEPHGDGARAATWGKCPECANERKIGLLLQGEHLVWREHWLRTWGSLLRQCHASGTRLCQAPAVTLPGERAPRCACDPP
jgi:hypothetical protein